MRIGKRQFTVILWVVFAAAFFLGGVANAAGWVSPVGPTWDFTVSGAKLGSACLIFSSDPNTVTGYILVIPSSTSAGTIDHAVSFGFTTLSGMWEFDQNGQVVGFMNNPPSDTVRLDITTFSGGVSSNGNVFKMSGQTVDGNLTFNGVQMALQTPLPELWTIEKIIKGDVTFTEIYVAQQDPELGGYYNLYDFAGWGADICVWGTGALSKQYNFGISFTEYPMPASGDCNDITPSLVHAGSTRIGTKKAAVAVSGGGGLGPSGPPPSTGIGSAGIGKINLKTGVANLAGYQEGSPMTKVTLPVFCQ
ncbi:MAG: hypothetical protein WAN11_15860 [Syntrophobacteraceae bacterium]